MAGMCERIDRSNLCHILPIRADFIAHIDKMTNNVLTQGNEMVIIYNINTSIQVCKTYKASKYINYLRSKKDHRDSGSDQE